VVKFPQAVYTGWSKKADTRETVWVSAFLDHSVRYHANKLDDAYMHGKIDKQ